MFMDAYSATTATWPLPVSALSELKGRGQNQELMLVCRGARTSSTAGHDKHTLNNSIASEVQAKVGFAGKNLAEFTAESLLTLCTLNLLQSTSNGDVAQWQRVPFALCKVSERARVQTPASPKTPAPLRATSFCIPADAVAFSSWDIIAIRLPTKSNESARWYCQSASRGKRLAGAAHLCDRDRDGLHKLHNAHDRDKADTRGYACTHFRPPRVTQEKLDTAERNTSRVGGNK